MELDPDNAGQATADRLAAARLEFVEQLRRFAQAQATLQAMVDHIHRDRPQREMLRRSAFARLQARLDTMPVIEQAKGILMAQERCGPDEAFDLLRRASQRANIKVAVLAAQIVEHVASQPGSPSDVTADPAAIGSTAQAARQGSRPGLAS